MAHLKRATGTVIKATAAELNTSVAGLTANTSELNALDGITSTVDELNTLDGFTGDKDDLIYAKDLKATGVTTAEFDYLDIAGGTAGTNTFLRGDKQWVTPTAGAGVSGHRTTCTVTNSSGAYGWCTGTSSNQNLSYSFGCSGNKIGTGWYGFGEGGQVAKESQCNNNGEHCSVICGNFGATCYNGAGNANWVSCNCFDGSVNVGAFGGYDYASPCS